MRVQGKKRRCGVDKSKPTLTGNVRVDLIKPLNADWPDIGKRLFDLRDIGHRLMNASLRGAASSIGKKKSGTTRPYVDEQLKSYQDWNAKQVAASKPGDEGGFHQRRAALNLVGTMVDTWRYRAEQLFATHKKRIMNGDVSLPSVRKGTPIPFRDGQWSLSSDEKGYVLSLKIFQGRMNYVQFAIAASGGGAHGHLRRMVSGDPGVKLGEVKLLRDEKKQKWFALISYSWPKPDKPVDAKHVMVVRRGMASILTAASSDGWFGRFEPATMMVGDERGRPSGCALIDAKRKFDARRRSIQRHNKDVGAGARGHGEARRLAGLRKIEDAEGRFVKTYCQQIGAWVAKEARAHGCGSVAIEAFGSPVDAASDAYWLLKRWPWAELKSAITWACNKAGIEIREVDATANVRRCANTDRACGHEHDSPQYGTFTCTACGWQRPADLVATFNMLHRLGETEATKTIDRKVKKARAKARSTVEEAAQ